jgi:hypothetical protein
MNWALFPAMQRAWSTLAAQAYLRDALEPVPQTLPLSLDTP